MKKIIFFGASVTHQKGTSGYFDNLSLLVGKDADLSRITFPSSEFCNAGFYNIDTVVSLKPDIVFLEWSTTGEKIYDEIDSDIY
jgi:ABC-type Fe3+-hydroxamate transport system substrate-binding protein